MGHKRTILLTGGAGFIGSHLTRLFVTKYPDYKIVNLDKLTYAGNLENLRDIENKPNYEFVKGDITDLELLRHLFASHSFDAVLHCAAESHVDRSIAGPAEFIQTNVVGTFSLLEESRAYFDGLPAQRRDCFRFLHVSTDEVFGSLGEHDPAFSETTPYAPNSPYSASKAGADHLVRAYFHTYGLPVLTDRKSTRLNSSHRT